MNLKIEFHSVCVHVAGKHRFITFLFRLNYTWGELFVCVKTIHMHVKQVCACVCLR
jgi:hypothetical protein